MQNLTARVIAWLALFLRPSGRHRSGERSPASIPDDRPTMELPRTAIPDRYAHVDELYEMTGSERAYWLTVLEQSAQIREQAAPARPYA